MALDQYLQQLNHHYPNIAYFYAILGNVLLSFMNIFFKFLTKIASPLQILFMRSFSLLIFNIWILDGKSPYIANPQTFRLVMLRIMCTSGSSAIMYYCVKYLPVSIVATLYNTSPIFIYFVQAFYYKKSFNKINLTLTILSFIGVILIAQPEFLFGYNTSLSQIKDHNFLIIAMLVSSILIGFGFLFMHDSAKSISILVNLQYSYIGHMFFASMFGNFNQTYIQFSKINLYYILMFFGLLCNALLCQYMIYASNTLMKPSKVMPFGYLSVVTSFLADLYIFQADFNFYSILGIVLTSLGLNGKLLLEKKATNIENERRIIEQQKTVQKEEQLVK